MNDIDTGTVQIKGLAELEKVLLAFPDKIAKNILIGGVRAGAKSIRNEARQRATTQVSGKMTLILSALINRGDIGTIREFNGQKITVPPGFMKSKIASWKTRKSPYAVTFNTGIAGWKDRASKFFAFYWRFLEFGTSKMAAKSFLRPAFESKKMEAVEQMREYLHERIDKEAPKQVNT
jgi:HK97 gp10 family phage protein